jgi:hypothetical protein
MSGSTKGARVLEPVSRRACHLPQCRHVRCVHPATSWLLDNFRPSKLVRMKFCVSPACENGNILSISISEGGVRRYEQSTSSHDRSLYRRGQSRRYKHLPGLFPIGRGVIDSGQRFAGHDAIRNWSDREFIGAHGRMTANSVEQTKNTIIVRADWKSNFYTGPARFEFMPKGKASI